MLRFRPAPDGAARERAMTASLRVQGLRKIHAGGAGVHDVCLSVARGGVTAFVGVNGAGKSTTLKCVLGLARPDAGEIELFGRPAGFEARRRVGYLPEERGLAARERARDVIAFHARLKGVERKEAYRRADALLERLGLEGRRKARVGELSKGNAQRVQILCALAHQPDLLILDEPLSGLDPVAQAEVVALFAEYRARGGAILFSTHAMNAAEKLSDTVVVLARGRTVFEGAVAAAVERAPHGVYVTADRDEAVVDAARRLGGEAAPMAGQIGQAVRWRVRLPKAVTHAALLRLLAEQGVAVHAFEPIKADLEAAFWDLVDHGAKGAGRRLAA
jgi:ABC-2 type transport system ATP-binding protein